MYVIFKHFLGKGNDRAIVVTCLQDQPLIPKSVRDLVDSGQARFAMINVWRNIRDVPVAKTPLAACDAATISKDSIVTFEIRYNDRVGENYMSRYDPKQRWYYFPKMVRDEAMMLKVWDSAGKDFRDEKAASIPVVRVRCGSQRT